jgi:hypothetical protein
MSPFRFAKRSRHSLQAAGQSVRKYHLLYPQQAAVNLEKRATLATQILQPSIGRFSGNCALMSIRKPVAGLMAFSLCCKWVVVQFGFNLPSA